MTKFYKTTIIIEIVSDKKPIEWDDIEDIRLEAMLNTYRIVNEEVEEISERAALEFCVATNNDPEWLGIGTED